ncbi:hypothetical protein ES703_79721 [subsurface metagenome]
MGFEKVRAHTGDVTDVIADVISDYRWVTRIVLRQIIFYLSCHIGPDVGAFCEYPAAYSAKQCKERCTKAKAGNDIRQIFRIVAVKYDKRVSAKADDANRCNGDSHNRATQKSNI